MPTLVISWRVIVRYWCFGATNMKTMFNESSFYCMSVQIYCIIL